MQTLDNEFYQLHAQSEEKSSSSDLSLPFLLTRVKNKKKCKKNSAKSKPRLPKPRYLSKMRNTGAIEKDALLQIQGNSIRIHSPHSPDLKLKQSTRKLIELIEDIQAKFVSRRLFVEESKIEKELVTGTKELLMMREEQSFITDPLIVLALKNVSDCVSKQLTLEQRDDNNFVVGNEPDQCSIYQRLTKKCVCLNRKEFNDFIIHFNEENKRLVNPLGEIIKNMRVLKKFLYMGGGYSKNALIFINEGLSTSTHGQKLEIIQGCCVADLCNVFDGDSLIKENIETPYEQNSYGDTLVQYLTARFISSLAGCEEGRRYLNFSPKVIQDIDIILRKKGSKLDCQCVNLLTRTLCVLNQGLRERRALAYCNKRFEEGSGQEVIRYLKDHRERMTTDEIFIHLNLLYNLTSKDHEKLNIFRKLPILLSTFKEMVTEYDHSEMNMIIINIFNNILTRNILNQSTTALPDSYGVVFPEMTRMQPKKKNIQCEKVIEKGKKNPNREILLSKEAAKRVTKFNIKI